MIKSSTNANEKFKKFGYSSETEQNTLTIKYHQHSSFTYLTFEEITTDWQNNIDQCNKKWKKKIIINEKKNMMDTSHCSFIITRLINLHFLLRNKQILRKEEYKQHVHYTCTNKHLNYKHGCHRPLFKTSLTFSRLFPNKNQISPTKLIKCVRSSGSFWPQLTAVLISFQKLFIFH